ncbi:MAG: hypothetical protein BMS9Abin32_370 [Gammaproteobacteria bacterium]|nr:MAG: hypothetical protein BMS9Abin32_370 [Gammaproteobacteria bacterium]
MSRWIDELCELQQRGERCMLVTIAAVRGSAPREVGAKMIVTAGHTIGTIGGGQLEHQCARLAVERLGRQDSLGLRRRIALGASLGQCCGGVVEVLFEYLEPSSPWPAALQRLYRAGVPLLMVTGSAGLKLLLTENDCAAFGDSSGHAAAITRLARPALAARQPAASMATVVAGELLLEPLTAPDFNIAIFGAGHVGAACVASLARLDCRIRWIDSRRELLPAAAPGNVECIAAEHPALQVALLPAGACCLVMTHSHPLDYEICAHILRRRDFAYCGLIGSRAKRRRFEKLMREQGMRQSLYRQLSCPIGVAGITGKQPAEIAVAVAAELLRLRDATAALRPPVANLHLLQQ